MESFFHLIKLNELLSYEKPEMICTWKAQMWQKYSLANKLSQVFCQWYAIISVMNAQFTKLALAVHVSLLWLSPIYGPLQLFLAHICHLVMRLSMRERLIHFDHYILSSICFREMHLNIFLLYDVFISSIASGRDESDLKLIEAQLGAICLSLWSLDWCLMCKNNSLGNCYSSSQLLRHVLWN